MTNLHTYIVQCHGKTVVGRAKAPHQAAELAAKQIPVWPGSKVEVARLHGEYKTQLEVQSNGETKLIGWSAI